MRTPSPLRVCVRRLLATRSPGPADSRIVSIWGGGGISCSYTPLSCGGVFCACSCRSVHILARVSIVSSRDWWYFTKAIMATSVDNSSRKDNCCPVSHERNDAKGFPWPFSGSQ